MEIIKLHKIVCEIRQFLSLDSIVQVLIASPRFRSMKNEDQSIIVCRCQCTVEQAALVPISFCCDDFIVDIEYL